MVGSISELRDRATERSRDLESLDPTRTRFVWNHTLCEFGMRAGRLCGDE
jgi:hypothetical protein